MLIDGKAIAAKRVEELRSKVESLKLKPKLVAVMVGSDPASEMYVKIKQKRAEEAGIESEICHLSLVTSIETIKGELQNLNLDKKVTGSLVQLPFPKESAVFGHEREILEAIDPIKDVDCLTSANMGLLAVGKPRFYPATVKGVLIVLQEGLKHFKSDWKLVDGDWNGDWLIGSGDKNSLSGLNATVVGRSEIVGKPMAIALVNLGATVTVCNSRTRDLSQVTSHADIIITATGVPGLVKKEMVKEGAVVIDCGAPKAEVDTAVAGVAAAITPVPGGIGPLTVVSLLENTVQAATRASS